MKRWKLFVFALVVLLSAGGLYLAYSAYSSARQEQEQIRKNLETKKQQEKNTVPAKAKKALDNNLRQAYNLELSYDKPTKTLTIVDTEANPAEGLDTPLFSTTYTNILNRGYFLFVHGGKIVFDMPGVEKLVLVQKMPIVTNGIESVSDGLKIAVIRTKFLGVDWAGLEGKPVHQQISLVAEQYFIHSLLAKTAPPASVLFPN